MYIRVSFLEEIFFFLELSCLSLLVPVTYDFTDVVSRALVYVKKLDSVYLYMYCIYGSLFSKIIFCSESFHNHAIGTSSWLLSQLVRYTHTF